MAEQELYSAQNNITSDQKSSPKTGAIESISSSQVDVTSQRIEDDKWNIYIAEVIDLKIRLSTYEKHIASLENGIKVARKTIARTRANILNTLAIFVAVFAFVFIEFQFLQRLTNTIQVVSLTCLLSGILLLFVMALDYLTSAKDDSVFVLNFDRKNFTKQLKKGLSVWSVQKLLFSASLCLIVMGLLMTLFTQKGI